MGFDAAGRLAWSAWVLMRWDALIPREAEPYLSTGPRLAGRALRLFAGPRARSGPPGERLAQALERLGPVAIKFGQFLSTRGDILGADFADELSHLKDRLDPFPLAQAREEIRRALGRPVEDLFAELDAAAAAASLAQAHPARLTDGRKVAVKVLRPGIEARVARDLAALRLAADLAEGWVPASRRLEPRAFVRTIGRALQLELDLRFEAAGADEIAAVMAADEYMAAPRVVWPGVARRVLTLEWAAGLPLTDPAALAQPGVDPRRVAQALVRAFLSQALDHGLFHADLHEGNLFVGPQGDLTAVDFGILGRLTPADRRYLAEILLGFLNRDYPAVAAAHFAAGYVPAGHDPAAFAQALRAVGEPVFGQKAGDISMGRLLTQLFDVTALFDMRLRPELILLQKTMVTVEGVARRIDPDHDIWAAAEPVVRRWMAREISPARRIAEVAGRAAALLARAGAEPAGPTGPPAPAFAAPTPERRAPTGLALAFVAGVASAALAFAAAALLR